MPDLALYLSKELVELFEALVTREIHECIIVIMTIIVVIVIVDRVLVVRLSLESVSAAGVVEPDGAIAVGPEGGLMLLHPHTLLLARHPTDFHIRVFGTDSVNQMTSSMDGWMGVEAMKKTYGPHSEELRLLAERAEERGLLFPDRQTPLCTAVGFIWCPCRRCGCGTGWDCMHACILWKCSYPPVTSTSQKHILNSNFSSFFALF